MRSKSDQNWMRELKTAIGEIYKRRYKLLVKYRDAEGLLYQEKLNRSINVNIDKISINVQTDQDSEEKVSEWSDPESIEEKLDKMKWEIAEKINQALKQKGSPIDDSVVRRIIEEVIEDGFSG